MKEVCEFEQAAQKLCPVQQQEAMRNLVEMANEPEAGIMRQLLAEPNKPLTPKQQHVFDKHILPTMVERCSTCKTGFSLAGGMGYCEVCAVKYT
jgi:hypothetical protein